MSPGIGTFNQKLPISPQISAKPGDIGKNSVTPRILGVSLAAKSFVAEAIVARAENIDCDILIVGGGVNGCGIARDAVGRGLQVVLCEQGDIAGATSSASTKLFHGGLRYLEHYEFGLVRKALIERDVLLRNMPHISWPLRFVLPHLKGMRPAWLLRLGLLVYDSLNLRKTLPGTRTIRLQSSDIGRPLATHIKTGFEYSDCWVNDARLVVLNAQDAADRGATILPRVKFEGATRDGSFWQARLIDTRTGEKTGVKTRILVNAAGPWVVDVIENKMGQASNDVIRLVRGSHIVTRKLYEHDRAFFFQNEDGRLVFSIPYEQDFTLIGTTDVDHDGDPADAACSTEELQYLCDVASKYFKTPVSAKDVVWTYSGVRPLNDTLEGNASSASRDYEVKIEGNVGEAPLINVFGGKITTYRKLAEEVVAELPPYARLIGKPWTSRCPLPGGDFPVTARQELLEYLQQDFPFLSTDQVDRMFSAYGTQASQMLRGMTTAKQMGQDFGAGLSEVEVRWLIDREWAQTAEDVVWRRSKLGLRMTKDQIETLDKWMIKEAA
jgi:glycerol-3-phosphate dehydrogenase